MKYKVLKKVDYVTTKWTGGDTTELYIYPEHSSYEKRDFLFRISSATVNLEKSIFTELDGVSRKLMLLSGKMELVHKDKYNKKLKPFEQDSFKGNWNTESYGKARDFNLMTRLNCEGKLEAIRLLPGLDFSLDFNTQEAKESIEVLYNLEADIKLSIEGQELLLEKEDSIIFFLDKDSKNCGIKIMNITESFADIIRSTVYLQK